MATTVTQEPGPPVEGGVLPQDVYVDVLLHQTVEQDGQRGEADVVQRQVGRVVQRLGEGEGEEGERKEEEGGGGGGRRRRRKEEVWMKGEEEEEDEVWRKGRKRRYGGRSNRRGKRRRRCGGEGSGVSFTLCALCVVYFGLCV